MSLLNLRQLSATAGKQYAGIGKVLRRYWEIYGGVVALLTSPYVHVSLAICLLGAGFWSAASLAWWNQPLQVLPNLLGFTLGGFAVFLGFGDPDFRALIAGQEDGDDRPSPYMQVSATFLHFVLVQVVALVWAAVTHALHAFPLPWPSLRWLVDSADLVFGGIGYWLYVYSLLCAAAAAIAVFRSAGMFDTFATSKKAESKELT